MLPWQFIIPIRSYLSGRSPTLSLVIIFLIDFFIYFRPGTTLLVLAQQPPVARALATRDVDGARRPKRVLKEIHHYHLEVHARFV